MDDFTLKRWLLAVCSLSLLVPCAATAAGLGRLTVLSALGQPFSAELELVSAQKGETITGRLASIDSYQQANLAFNAALVGTRVTLERRPNGTPYLKVTTPRPVYEPFAELLIELNSENGKITRQYTVLLDPPGYGRAAAELPPPPIAAPTVRTPPANQQSRAAPAPQDSRGPATSEPPVPSAAQESPALAAAAPVAPAETSAPGPAAAARPVPSAKPAPRAAEAAAPAPVDARQYGPVKRGETLGRIAGIVKPDGVTLEQTLVGLYRQNPDAFIKKNMNLVKSGRILKVPEANEMSSLPQREAVQEVRLQVADFNSFRDRVADRVANAPEDGSVTSGRIGAARVAENDAAAARDTVKLSRVDAAAAKGGGKGAGSERLRALEEEAVAREKSLADANERIAQLEKTIKDMQRLAEMKGAGKAAQAQAGGDKAGAAPRGAPAGEGPTGGVVAVAAVIPPPPPAAAKAPEPVPASPPTAGKAVPLEMAQAPAPQSEPGAPAAKAKPAAPAPAPAAEPDLIDTIMNEPLYLAAAGGAVVVLGGLALVAARRRRGNGNERLVKISPTLSSEPDSARSGVAAPASPAANAAPTPAPAVPKPSVLERERPAPKPAPAPAVAATPATAASAAAPPSEDNDLDFNAGIRRAAASKAAPAADTMSAAQAAPRAPSPGVTPADQTKTVPTKPQATAPAAAPDPSFASMHKAADSRPEPSLADFALNIPDAGPAEPHAPRETTASDLNMDFNLEPLPPIDTPADSKTRVAPAADATDLDFKLDDLSLNFGPDAAPVTSGKDDHWYDVQQKFDLAKAYEEMGDKDGAREILQEVVKEGDSEQQTQAKKLLGSLG